MAIYTGQGTNNDIFVGTSGSDTFTGNRGNDQMTGNGGNDVFVFDRLFDRDIIYDFSEGDRLDFSRFHISDFASLQPFMTQSGADVIIQFTLGDVIERLTLRNTALASLTASDMIFDTSVTAVYLTGGIKADALFGAGGADVLRGEAGDDRIFGGAAVDRIYGGDGRDILDGGAGNDRIYSGQGGGTMRGGGGNDLLVAESTNVINATEHHTVYGGAGNDVFRPFNRGFGVYFIEDFELGDRIDLSFLGVSSLAQLKTYMYAPGGSTNLTAINLGYGGYTEGIYIRGINPNQLTEADFILATSSEPRLVTTSEVSLKNILFGGNGDDTMIGGDGQEIFEGGRGADTMTGGDRADVYYVDHVRDKVVELADDYGNDIVYSRQTFNGSGNFIEKIVLTGTADINARGGDGDETLTGNSGSNGLNGGRGGDVMNGGAGDDVYYVDNGRDWVIETRDEAYGHDRVFSSVSYTISKFSGVEDVTLIGSKKINVIGNSLMNVLTGNDNANILRGGGHKDVLIGGGGADIFDYNAASESSINGYDRIADLNDAEDIIDLTTIDADSTVAGDQAFTLVEFFTGGGGEITLSYDAATNFTTLFADIDGNLKAEMRIVINGNHEGFMGIQL